jgi:HD-GYP domain-containing protein (c-di-GMP phosphodiesterase class II)
MIASDRLVDFSSRRDSRGTLARVSERTFGDTGWVSLALKSCIEHLVPAIGSGDAHRVANTVRAIAHAPTLEQVDDVITAACDAVLSDAYAARDPRSISLVADARTVIGLVIAELRDRSEREAVAPYLLRETVDGYVRLVALVNKRIAERLDAVGNLAVRIGSVMQLSAPDLLDIELAGRLHDIGMLSVAGAASVEDVITDHVVAAENFVKSVPSLAHLAPIVRAHHERFDGQGTPDGLTGAEIPLASRIIAVAAAFVDLVTGSTAHKAALPNRACQKIAVAAATRFDPDVVAATLHLLRFRHRTNRSA